MPLQRGQLFITPAMDAMGNTGPVFPELSVFSSAAPIHVFHVESPNLYVLAIN